MAFHKKIAILGGDTRQVALANRCATEGYVVWSYALPPQELLPQIFCVDDWRLAEKNAAAVLLPLPSSVDGVHLNQPLVRCEGAPTIEEICAETKQGTPILGGKISASIKKNAAQKGVWLYDYFENESLQQKNALPTAEGAVSILMREIPRTVSGLSVGVTGYGRVAKALVDLLLAMGAHVTVLARKQAVLDEAARKGCCTVLLKEKKDICAFAKGQAAVFNTVPHCIFTSEVLREMARGTLIVDLASAPGGVDANGAGVCGIKVIWALSLPGKYAPITAGEIIAETVLTYLREEGVL